jgi:hypothetical protein
MIDHLLVVYVFNKELWYKFLHRFGWHALTSSQQITFLDWWM